jgi:DNA alkylation damage repair protein AlkB
MKIRLAPGAVLLKGFAAAAEQLLQEVEQVAARAPFRYDALDPQSGEPWPAMPASFRRLAADAAAAAGFAQFAPDACLINRYAARARLTLHQDRNERDLRAPIVSVSLGAPAVFLFGGAKRAGALALSRRSAAQGRTAHQPDVSQGGLTSL